MQKACVGKPRVTPHISKLNIKIGIQNLYHSMEKERNMIKANKSFSYLTAEILHLDFFKTSKMSALNKMSV